jgi:hypothetical protein
LKKIDFLTDIAYLLTYPEKITNFSDKELYEIYKEIHAEYSLPKNEMKIVIAEIESHTGIIMQTGFNRYEFSHSTFQEYLTAEYLVTLQMTQEVIDNFYVSPEPFAIATCISKDSGKWLASLILHEEMDFSKFRRKTYEKETYLNALYEFLSRLILESPAFKVREELGFALLYLIFEVYKRGFADIIEKLMNKINAAESVIAALPNYNITRKPDNVIYLKSKKEIENGNLGFIPQSGYLPSNITKIIKSQEKLLTNNKLNEQT